MNLTKIPTRDYCNCLAQQRGLDPVGHAGDFEDAIVIEAPLPWKRDMMQQVGVFQQPIIDLLALWLQRYYAGEGYPHRPLVIAPDESYSQAGYRRVMLFTRPPGLFSRFSKVEYLVPVAELGALVWSLYEDRAVLPRFDAYRVPNADSIRDLLVCTHGTIDAACAKFGYPLYKHMRDHCADDTALVWRVSHFGGHVFAPTFMDMPTGHYWAYVGAAQAEQIMARSGDVAALRGHYRGWAGVESGFLQAAECELWQQHGWAWFDYPKSAEIVAQDTSGEWADVRISYHQPGDLALCVADCRVEVSNSVETEVSTGDKKSYAYPQYRTA